MLALALVAKLHFTGRAKPNQDGIVGLDGVTNLEVSPDGLVQPVQFHRLTPPKSSFVSDFGNVQTSTAAASTSFTARIFSQLPEEDEQDLIPVPLAQTSTPAASTSVAILDRGDLLPFSLLHQDDPHGIGHVPTSNPAASTSYVATILAQSLEDGKDLLLIPDVHAGPETEKVARSFAQSSTRNATHQADQKNTSLVIEEGDFKISTAQSNSALQLGDSVLGTSKVWVSKVNLQRHHMVQQWHNSTGKQERNEGNAAASTAFLSMQEISMKTDLGKFILAFVFVVLAIVAAWRFECVKHVRQLKWQKGDEHKYEDHNVMNREELWLSGSGKRPDLQGQFHYAGEHGARPLFENTHAQVKTSEGLQHERLVVYFYHPEEPEMQQFAGWYISFDTESANSLGFNPEKSAFPPPKGWVLQHLDESGDDLGVFAKEPNFVVALCQPQNKEVYQEKLQPHVCPVCHERFAGRTIEGRDLWYCSLKCLEKAKPDLLEQAGVIEESYSY